MPPVAFEDQRVDLRQAGVGFHVAAVQALQHVGGLRLAGLRYADAQGQLACLRVAQAGQRIDEDLDDLLRRVVGHLLDVHAAFGAAHQHHLLCRAVGQHGNVVLLLDVRAFLDQQAPNLLAGRPGLMGDQLHAENLAGQRLQFVQRAGQFHTAAFAAAARVNLRLDDPDLAAQALRRIERFLHRESGIAARHRNAEVAQQLLALVFVDLHRGPMGEVAERAAARPADPTGRRAGVGASRPHGKAAAI